MTSEAETVLPGLDVFARAAVGLVVLDAAGRIDRTNPRFAAWLGRPAGDLVGCPLGDLVRPAERERLEEALRQVRHDPVAEPELRLLLAVEVGDPLAVRVTLTRAGDDGALVTVQRMGEWYAQADDPGDGEHHPTGVLQGRLLQSLEEGVFGVDRDARYTFLNPAACRLLGFASEAQALGLDSHATSHHSHPDGSPYPREECPIHRVLLSGEPVEAWEDTFWRAYGSPFPVRVYAAPLWGVHGAIEGVVVSFQDETVRQEREGRLAKAARNLPGAIFQYRQYPDGRAVFPYASDGAQQVFGVSSEQVMRDPAIAFSRVHADDLPQVQASIEASVREMQAWHVRFRVRHPANGWIWVEGRSTPEALTDGSVLWHGVMIDISERMAAEQALRERERELSEAQAMAHLGSWVWELAEDRMYWSDEVYRILGQTRDAQGASLQRFLDAVHPDDRERVDAAVRAGLAGKPYDLHFRVRRPDGDERQVHLRAAVELDEHARPLRLVGTGQDLTEWFELEENQRRLIDILEGTPDVVAMHDPDGAMLFMNAAGRHLFGLPEAPAEPWRSGTGWDTHGLPGEGRSVENTVHRFQPPWAARQSLEEAMPVALRDGVWQGETAVVDRDGREVPVSQVVIVRRGERGEVRQISTIIRDISGRKAIEDALRESETRFRQLASSVEEVFWLREDERLLYVNPAFEGLWGVSQERLYAEPAALLDPVHVDDRARVADVIRTETGRRTGGEETFRLVHPNSGVRWVRLRCYPVADAEGNVTRSAATAVDVTELKYTQQQLEHVNAELERQAFFDRLTGAANRRYFESLLDREAERADRYGTPFALVMFDLDHFKRVNDTWGHDTGDLVLQEVVRIAEERLREADVLGRWGGEEFMILLPGDSVAQAGVVAEAVRARIAEHGFPQVGQITISLGVAGHRPGEPRKALLRRVDEALYRAKRQGRDRVVMADNGRAGQGPA
ncbi:PAS domain-containing protein [Thioalkalivibrio sp. ALR17-21]|uniref:PAS domain-containing protein n=1 Tax=Thioalkalivibrio sp. ALR17-21 TaxID=1269813 RepID=UPI00041E774F|nr:PAS domain-containing protein [Thioalkalivibrio sp. ALR17-21]